MNIAQFSTDDGSFVMLVDVLDKNSVIGILETLRGFDSIASISLEKIEEKEDMLTEDVVKEMGLNLVAAKPAADDTDADADAADDAEEVVVATVDDTDAADGLSVSKIGTIYLKHDFETGDDYYIRKYVEFQVNCVYAPKEQIEIVSNVDIPEEVTE